MYPPDRFSCAAALGLALSAVTSLAHSAGNDGAMREAREQISKWLVKCGNQSSAYAYSFQYGNGRHTLELRKPALEVRGAKLSEIDRLNGVEWDGVVTLSGHVQRLTYNGKWNDWEKAWEKQWSLQRKKGVWSQMPSAFGYYEWETNASCEQIALRLDDSDGAWVRAAKARAVEKDAQGQAAKQGVATEPQRAIADWADALSRHIARNWVRPPEAGEFECLVRLQLLPDGTVTNARIEQSCGSAQLDKSVEDAVFRASPLPKPDDPSIFERDLTIRFAPEP